MKVFHVITRLIIGGAQENTVLTCRGLADKGHDVTLISGPETGPEGSLWDEVKNDNYSYQIIDSLRRNVRPALEWQAYRDMVTLFKNEKPDIVHTHSSKAGILGRMAARKANVPIIIHTIHGMSFNRTQPAYLQSFYKILEKRTARYTDSIITVADAMIDQSVEAGIAPKEKFQTIRSGMIVSPFFPSQNSRDEIRNKLGFTSEHIVVGTIARLFKNKGYEQLLEIIPSLIKENPNIRFIWIGDGAHRDLYYQQLKEHKIENHVHFTGLLPPSDVPVYINAFDILAHASKWEGLPRAVVQGLLCKIPAVAFDNDGTPEVLIENETGKLIPFGNTHKMKNAILELSRDENLRNTLGNTGHEKCKQMFDWNVMVNEIDELYTKIKNRLATSTSRFERG